MCSYGWNTAPVEILHNIFRYIPAQQRFGAASLVSTSWRLAAHHVTTALSVKVKDQQAYDQLHAWLNKHDAGRIAEAHLQAADGSSITITQQLPVQHLHTLKLQGFHMQLSAVLVQDLTKLVVINCILLDDSAGLDGLAARSPHLQHLQLSAVRNAATSGPSHARRVHLPSTTLAQLQKLTSLELNGVGCMLRFLDKMTPLQELVLPDVLGLHRDAQRLMRKLGDIQHLRLRKLCLGNSKVSFSTATTPWLTALTALEDLSFGPGCQLDPELLYCSTKLTRLVLNSTKLLPVQGGTAALLRVLYLFEHLQQLDLCNTLQRRDLALRSSYVSTGHASAFYGGITSSKQLRVLRLAQCYLPTGAWELMFPAGRMQPKLQELVLGGTRFGDLEPVLFMMISKGFVPAGDSGSHDHAARLSEERWVDLQPDHTQCLAAACPSLRQLAVTLGSTDAAGGQALAPLQQMPQLRQLSVTPFSEGVAAELAQLAGLTGLSMFSGDLPPSFVPALLQLTQLTNLQCCELASASQQWIWVNKAGSSRDSDVWQQIYQHWQQTLDQPGAR